MTAPTIASLTTSNVSDTLGDINMDVSPGTVDGNLLLSFIASSSASTDALVALTAGWTALLHTHANATSSVDLYSMYRIASSEPANYNFTATPNDSTYGMTGKMIRVTGHDPTTPIHASADASTATAPSVNLVIGDCLILRVVAEMNASGVVTFGLDASLTERWNFGVGSPRVQTNSQACGSVVQTTATPTGPVTFTGGGGPIVTQTIVIGPAVGPTNDPSQGFLI